MTIRFRKFQKVTKSGCCFLTLQITCSTEHVRACRQRWFLNKTAPHPDFESVPRLFLRVDAVGLGPADGPDVGLMALLEVDELEGGQENHDQNACNVV